MESYAFSLSPVTGGSIPHGIMEAVDGRLDILESMHTTHTPHTHFPHTVGEWSDQGKVGGDGLEVM